ncbi:uroporphyrinogen-III synthase [Pseudomonas sp. NPDC007930]|uniref:uroporphyrinogen-III synthase n=1 Tax=Pseudomonas sp. NPDC007930 TaxID=3364417 RepID=UPI0036E87DAF
MSAWRLLITRAQPGADAQAQALRGLGHYASVLPLMAIEALAPSAAQRARLAALADYQAVIAVSQPAAQLLGEHLAAEGLAAPVQNVFAVGAATAATLREFGLPAQSPQGGEDSEALLAFAPLRACLAQPGGRVLIVRGEGGREALADGLLEQGAGIDYLELYRRRCPVLDGRVLLGRIEAERLNALVVSSGQGFEHLHALAGEAWPALAGLPVFVPSQRVAGLAVAAGAQHVIVCAGAGTSALAQRLVVSAVP